MRVWARLTVATGVTVMLAAYAELALDIRAPRSNLKEEMGLGASAYLSLDEYNKKIRQMQDFYGDRAEVILEPSTGEMTVTVDGGVIERGQVARRFAAMYGVIVVTPPAAPDSTFPFDIEPGKTPVGHEPNIARLQARLGTRLPAKYLAYNDADWSRDSCALLGAEDLGFGRFAEWLHLRSETFCIVRWKGAQPASMLLSVTRADGDPWMRPFARRICRNLITTVIERLGSIGQPDYAACVLVDRPDRTGPTGAQEAFTAVVYEIRDGRLARID